jgi:hypothetical protein
LEEKRRQTALKLPIEGGKKSDRDEKAENPVLVTEKKTSGGAAARRNRA